MKEKVKKMLEDGSIIPFVSMTQNLGRAEFSVCAQYKRGFLVKLTLHPLQQEDCSYFLEWEGKTRGFGFQGYQGLGYPNAWSFMWCKDHKCQSFRIYVPVGSNFIWFSESSFGVTIGFLETNINKQPYEKTKKTHSGIEAG